MWHFERILVGPYKGAFIHPCFVRGNKGLCGSMSRHHLPTPEMYSQAFSAKTNQFVLDQPNQLVLDRTEEQMYLQNKKNTDCIQPQMSVMPGAETSFLGERQQSKSEATPTPTGLYTNSSFIPSGIFAGSKFDNSRPLAFEEDWSLLSDCLDRVLNPSLYGDGEGLIGMNESRRSSSLKASNANSTSQYFIPVHALAPGMNSPASPATVERLFEELGNL